MAEFKISAEAQKIVATKMQGISVIQNQLNMYLEGVAEGKGLSGNIQFDHKKMAFIKKDEPKKKNKKGGNHGKK